MKYIKMIDIFGAQYRQQISLNQKVQKSVLSGICSLIVLGASFGYFLYVMNEWWSSKILPKSTNIMKVENYSQIQYNEDSLFEFSYWKYSDQQIDPFRLQNNILTPIGIYFINGIPQKPFSLLSEKPTISPYNTSLLRVDNLTLVQNSGFDKSLNYTTELMIVITSCNSTLLNSGYQCASDEEIQEFFKKSINYISFWLNLKQYDPYSQKFQVVKKHYYLTFDSEISHQGQLILTQTQATIDHGILFSKQESKSYIYNAQFITSATSIQFWSTLFKQNTYLNLFIRLDPMSIDTQIVYPKLGEILAQVGSIMSMLMTIQYILRYYNEHMLELDFVDKLLGFYYQDYLELKQSKDKTDLKTCKELIEEAKKKLVYTNIIYELSRIQLFLLHHFGRNQLFQAHQYAICAKEEIKSGKYCLAFDIATIPRPDRNREQTDQHFEKDDFSLLSRGKTNITKNNEELVRIQLDVGSASQKSLYS